MKKYIFMTHSIVKVGGAEIYLRNKCNYLKEKGWQVYIFSYDRGRVLISDLQEFEACIIRKLSFSPVAFSWRERQRVLDKLCLTVAARGDDEIVVESNNFLVTLWAELLTERLGARHLVYELQEDSSIYSPGLLDFLRFKYERREFAGITERSLVNFFSSYFEVPESNRYFLRAYCSNSIEDVDTDLVSLPSADVTIGSLGRIEKPFVRSAVEGMGRFIEQHPDLKFNVVFIGGERNGHHREREIRKNLGKYPNVRVYITGLLFPIPAKLLYSVDVFLSSAGSAFATANLGIPTISYDANDLQPIGILRHTTQNSIFRGPGEPPASAEELLSEVLIQKKYPKNIHPVSKAHPDFSSHMDFVSQMSSRREYYDFKNYTYSRKEKLYRMLLMCLGYHVVDWLRGVRKYLF